MNNTKIDSGADLEKKKVREILDCSIEELMEKAWSEKWEIAHVELWLKVKNAQILEKMLNLVRDRLEAPVIL